MGKRIIIVGGGVAGLAAAAALAPGHDVLLLEARQSLGGRAGSFVTAGGYVDACQHVSLGCCSALHRLLDRANLGDQLVRQPTIWFHTLDGRVSAFGPGILPWPLHLAPSFFRAHWLSLADKVAIARAVLWLKTNKLPARDIPLKDWLALTGQTRGAIENLWGPIVVSALNEPWETASFLAAAKVFIEGMLGPREAFQMELPRTSLRELYDISLGGWLVDQGVTIQRETRVGKIFIQKGAVHGVQTRSGEFLSADGVILAIPPHQWAGIIEPQSLGDKGFLKGGQNLKGEQNLGWAPITGIHLWIDRPLTDLPHAALVGTEGQWLFRHREAPRFPKDSSHYHQVVISASAPSLKQGTEALTQRILAELARIFPAMRKASVLESRVVTERRATIRPVPGYDASRPEARTPVRGLVVAGDWVATGWPSTMEGAVRGGEEAARTLSQEFASH